MATLLTVIGFVLPAEAQIRMGGSKNQIDISYTNPKRYEIGGITISGTRFLDPATMKSITGLKEGDEIQIPGEKISNAIKKLWDQNILGDVEVNITKVDGNYIFLDFKVKERPRLSKFSFRGVRKGVADDLKEKIHLIRGRIVTDALVKNTQNVIKKFLSEKGYMNATVNVIQIQDSAVTNTVALRFEIDKKTKVKINRINFEGNTQYTDEALRKKFKETKQRRIWRVFKASRFRKDNYEKDKKSLIEYYNKQGFRDAVITSDTVYTHDSKSVNVDIKIDEGNRYYFRDIKWTGNYLYDSKTLDRVLGIGKGDIYNMETLNRKLEYNPSGMDISSLYMDDGYLFFHVEPVEVAVENDSIDIEMRITEGNQAIINKINVSGNTKTNDHVILREIRTLPGQKFSRSDLIRSQREISQLGYFDPEQIGMVPVPDPEKGTVDINYTVVERPSDQVELSGGWGGYYGFVGTLGLTFNNFSARNMTKLSEWTPLPGGDGQRLSLRMQANGQQYQSYSASFTEPWLGGKKPNSFTVALTHSKQTASATADLGVSGVTVSLGKRLKKPDDFFTLMNSLSLQRYYLHNYGLSGFTFNNGPCNVVSYTTTLARNSINNPTFPSSGSSVSLSVSLTPPYSLFRKNNNFANEADRFKLIEYYKTMFDATWYTPLAKNLVLSTRAHMGWIAAYNNKLGIGPFERFKMGGSGLSSINFIFGYDIVGLRGYNDNKIGPAIAGSTDVGAGTIYNKFVTDIRYAVSTNPAATIYVLTFLEGGNNWGSAREYNPFKIYRSGGVGARVFMPAFGLLGIDYGWPFDVLPGNDGAQFHFTIGQQIR
ncbi:MAG: outer membrane protein assembly factor BamA [Bacteroidota bacterium]